MLRADQEKKPNDSKDFLKGRTNHNQLLAFHFFKKKGETGKQSNFFQVAIDFNSRYPQPNTPNFNFRKLVELF